MQEGELRKRPGCLLLIGIWLLLPIAAVIVAVPFLAVYNAFQRLINGQILQGIFELIFSGFIIAAYYGVFLLIRKFVKRKTAGKKIKPTRYGIELQTESGAIQINNPFRGFEVFGANGSGKSESIAVPLLSQFIGKRFSGLTYDFKYPALANDIQAFLDASGSNFKHFCIDFNNPEGSARVNPLKPAYLLNTSYAREYAQAIINNLMKESIKNPDFWSRSATDLLTACIWYLKDERPDICDFPHVCAMITSNDTALINKLQENPVTAQMTISIKNAMDRKAEGQTAGVIGALQGAIAQINTPELMYIFGGDDFSLDVNDPQNPILLTVGTKPTLVTTLSPLCSLIITVATKIMNQPGKHPSFLMLDEAPTCYIPNLEVLPNTGRSNLIAPVIMCQDLAQLTDGYGKEKADVLFASCNNHFYGRVASSHTAEIFSKQFGKTDKTFVTSGESGQGLGRFILPNKSDTESVQERDIIRAGEFLQFGVGEFAGVVVESNRPTFRTRFKTVDRPPFNGLQKPHKYADIYGYYKQVRHDVNKLLGITPGQMQNTGHTGEGAINNLTQTNSRSDERNNPFDVFGD